MNPETGAIYLTEMDIAAARGRGEPLVEMTCCAGHAEARNRKERRAADKACPARALMSQMEAKLAELARRD